MRTTLQAPTFPQTMPRIRFHLIQRYIHFSVDNATGTNGDRLYKIRTNLDIVVNKSNETPTWCNAVQVYFCRVTVHVSGASARHQEYLKLVQRPLAHVLSLQVSHHISLFLQSNSTCFGRKRPSSGVFKTSTAATGTCVIVAGKSSHLLISAE